MKVRCGILTPSTASTAALSSKQSSSCWADTDVCIEVLAVGSGVVTDPHRGCTQHKVFCMKGGT